MRTIKFRGKSLETGQWHYGYYKQDYLPNTWKAIHYIVALDFEFEVMPETVGEFTGLHDHYGREVYEGDIIRFPDIAKEAEVAFVLGEFVALDMFNKKYSLTSSGDYMVIRNKHDKQ